MNIGTTSLAITILIALSGYLFTYWNSIRLSRRTERLVLITERINKFYGPLFIITKTIDTAYQAQLKKFGREQVYKPGEVLSEMEWKENYAWVMSVFVPLNEELSDIILHNAHLIREKNMPEVLLKLVAHVSVTKALIHRWNEKDFSEKYPAIDFPFAEIIAYARQSYEELKAEQIQIIGQ